MDEQRELFRFHPEDFADIDEHVQKWRWDSGILSEIRILETGKARRVYSVLANYVSDRVYQPSERYFSNYKHMNVPTRDLTAVSEWLQLIDLGEEREVLICYGSDRVFLVKWEVFHVNWDSFCHPASDDIVICPLSEDWVLFYYHEDEFFFGKPEKNPPS